MANKSYKHLAPVKPSVAIVNSYTLIAAVYCAASAALFEFIVGDRFLAVVHRIAFLIVILNYIVLLMTKNYQRATHFILMAGTFVVTSLFATGGWEGTGYIWTFAYLPYAFFLANQQTSRLWVAVLVAVDGVLFALDSAGIIDIPYSLTQIGVFFASLGIFLLCMLLYQEASYRNITKYEKSQHDLSMTNEKLADEIKQHQKSEEELSLRAAELEKVNKYMMERELKMVELKEKIKQLESKK